MTELEVRDLDVIQDALVQRAGDARTVREELRCLEVEARIRAIRSRLLAEPCACDHHNRSHRQGPTSRRCRICSCTRFRPAQTPGQPTSLGSPLP